MITTTVLIFFIISSIAAVVGWIMLILAIVVPKYKYLTNYTLHVFGVGALTGLMAIATILINQ